MTIDVRFDLRAVVKLAEHAAAAAGHVHPAGTGRTGPALVLHGSTDGIWLKSNGLPALDDPFLPDAAGQQPTPTPDRAIRLAEMLPLGAPADNPLLRQLRAGAAAGYHTLIIRACGDGLDLCIARRRVRHVTVSLQR
jgi:hypothetical protein